jgi:hypothetical protein
MAEEQVERMLVSLKRLASLTEAEMHELFEKLSSVEKATFTDADARADSQLRVSLGEDDVLEISMARSA